MKRCCLLISVSIFLFQHSYAQADSTNYIKSLKNTFFYFNQVSAQQSQLYYGIRQDEYYSRIAGQPYFITNDWVAGNIRYNGLSYENVLMRFDEVAEKVICQHPLGDGVALASTGISSFQLSGHNFYSITDGTITGFYDRLYTGKITLLVRRKKIIEETIERELTKKFIDASRFYIMKNYLLTDVPNEGAVMRILADKKKELQQYIRKNNLSLRKDPERTLLAIVTYYDTL